MEKLRIWTPRNRRSFRQLSNAYLNFPNAKVLHSAQNIFVAQVATRVQGVYDPSKHRSQKGPKIRPSDKYVWGKGSNLSKQDQLQQTVLQTVHKLTSVQSGPKP
jgi:hypothetical protein